MHAEFDGCGFSSFRNLLPSSLAKNFFGLYVIVFFLQVLVFVFFFYVMSLSLFCAVSFYVLSFYESFLSTDYIIHWGQKIELAQKFHTMHGNQFWLAWLLQFWRFSLFCLPSKRPKFPFGPCTIVHGGQKIKLIRIGSNSLCKYVLM